MTSADRAPGHDDLMVTPESIDAWLEKNPLPEKCTCGGNIDQPADEHDISCPLALPSTPRDGAETRTIIDPFLGKDVEISSKLVDRLRGRYACGPVMPNGEPEFGWREFETSPIQREAADRIDALVASLNRLQWACEQLAMTRTLKVYEAMIDSGQGQGLLELDNARREARELLRALVGGMPQPPVK